MPVKPLASVLLLAVAVACVAAWSMWPSPGASGEGNWHGLRWGMGDDATCSALSSVLTKFDHCRDSMARSGFTLGEFESDGAGFIATFTMQQGGLVSVGLMSMHGVDCDPIRTGMLQKYGAPFSIEPLADLNVTVEWRDAAVGNDVKLVFWKDKSLGCQITYSRLGAGASGL